MLSMTMTIKRTVPGRPLNLSDTAPAVGVGITLVQEMLEPELAGLQPRDCAGPLAQARGRGGSIWFACSCCRAVLIFA